MKLGIQIWDPAGYARVDIQQLKGLRADVYDAGFAQSASILRLPFAAPGIRQPTV